MQHKGNKSEETIRCEQLFMAVMRALGMTCFYEQRIGTGTIDFVVGQNAGDSRMYYDGMTGVELKATMNDLRTGNGLNVRAFPFNYVLVPEKIAYSAVKYMEKYPKDFRHVGLLVLMDDYTLDIHRYASPVMPESNKELMQQINKAEFEQYHDSVALALGHFGDNPVTVHNFKTNESKTVKIWFEVEEKEVDLDGRELTSA